MLCYEYLKDGISMRLNDSTSSSVSCYPQGSTEQHDSQVFHKYSHIHFIETSCIVTKLNLRYNMRIFSYLCSIKKITNPQNVYHFQMPENTGQRNHIATVFVLPTSSQNPFESIRVHRRLSVTFRCVYFPPNHI